MTVAGSAQSRVGAGLILLTFSHLVQHLYSAGLTVIYPFVISDLRGSYTELGVILAVAGVVSGTAQLWTGLLRQLSTRLILAIQNLLLGVATVLGALAPGFAVFGAARIFGGVVYWPQHAVGSAYLMERYPTRRGWALSWHTTGGSMGSFVAPLFVAAAIELWGWRTALIVLAGALVLGGMVVGLRLPPDRDASHDLDPQNPPIVPLRTLLRRRAVLVILVASVISAGGRGLGVLAAYVPAYLHSGLDFDAVGVGIVVAVLMAASVIGPVLAGYVSDRVGRLLVLYVSYALGALSLVAFVLVGAHLGALVAIAVLMGSFCYAESPLLQSLFADVLGEADSRGAFGVFFAIGFGVGSLWFSLIGLMIDRLGFRPAFLGMAASFLVSGVVLAVGLHGRMPRRPGRSREEVVPPE